ncbi:hypothetical protein RFI_14372 [Reticulomyxa filosa]|uniref:Kelch motif family protein n=1 Tax=Reticulomyxa filosa TaxID=46433 RepID=X6NA89_RETFI|nr:hypothetical protein RFI_14372 [Reticulomyxa filosa]|eukprot:ETO22818.1 hypothetical protein RFI_14372 [Reticulomyxa filosa]
MQALQDSDSAEASGPICQFLCDLPVALNWTQCVLLGEEILICGGVDVDGCYSYHIKKDAYKFICNYLKNIPRAHSVIICEGSSKEATLISFGGYKKHTLVMKYKSVWDENSENKNEWRDAPKEIAAPTHSLGFVRSLIGGSKNQFMFVLNYPTYITVLDVETLQEIAKVNLFSLRLGNRSCFVQDEDGLFVFCLQNGLRIRYDEMQNTLEYQNLTICLELQHTLGYSYICINGFVVLLGGYNCQTRKPTDTIYLYIIKKNKWVQCIHKLPFPLDSGFAIVTKDGQWIHIIGGYNGMRRTDKHFRIKVKDIIGITEREAIIVVYYWLAHCELKRLGWIDDFFKIISDFLCIQKKKDKNFKFFRKKILRNLMLKRLLDCFTVCSKEETKKQKETPGKIDPSYKQKNTSPKKKRKKIKIH